MYLDDGIQWTTGDYNGGVNGIGGTEAQVGYDAGDGVNFLNVDGSRTASIIDIETTSNVDVPGVYVFQLGFAPPGGVDDCKRTCVASDKELMQEVWVMIM